MTFTKLDPQYCLTLNISWSKSHICCIYTISHLCTNFRKKLESRYLPNSQGISSGRYCFPVSIFLWQYFKTVLKNIFHKMFSLIILFLFQKSNFLTSSMDFFPPHLTVNDSDRKKTVLGTSRPIFWLCFEHIVSLFLLQMGENSLSLKWDLPGIHTSCCFQGSCVYALIVPPGSESAICRARLSSND